MINIKSDSRKIRVGDIFVALKGISSNGDDYILKAIENGATTIITESDNKYNIETIKVEDYSSGPIVDTLNKMGDLWVL